MQPGEIERCAPGPRRLAWSTTLEDLPAARPARPRARRDSAPADASPISPAAANPVPARASSRSRASAPPPDASGAPSIAMAPRSRATARRRVVAPEVIEEGGASPIVPDDDVVHHQVAEVHGEASKDALPPTGPVSTGETASPHDGATHEAPGAVTEPRHRVGGAYRCQAHSTRETSSLCS